MLAQALDTGSDVEDIEQTLVGVDLTGAEAGGGLLGELVGVAAVGDDVLDVGIGQGLVLILGGLQPEGDDAGGSGRGHRGA